MSSVSAPAGALLGIALTVGSASAQATADGAHGSPNAVTLDQLSASTGTRAGGTRAADLDGPQPPRPSRSAAVTSTEITDRAEGRTVATAPLAGEDRCDAASGRDRTELCRKRIEARAGQFSRPAPAVVTPEGRLLMLIRPPGSTMNADGGSRQLGSVSGLNDPNGPAEQIAGALRDRATQDANAAAAQAKPADPGTLPPGVPTTVVLPTR